MTIGEAAACLGIQPGNSANLAAEITAVVSDSKKVVPGSLFVCIAGKNVDGHDYAGEAIKNGAVAILAQKKMHGISAPVFETADTVASLGKLANYWRNKTRAKVIGITGTAGKTTVKEILSQLLASHAKTAKSALNHNNQIGLPLSILETDGDEKYWIMEVGISHEGDMDELGAILQPDLAVIVNAGPGHLEGLGKTGVAHNKAKLLDYLKPGGEALVSGDYPDLVRETAKYSPSLFSTNSVHLEAAWKVKEHHKNGKECELDLAGSACAIVQPILGEAGTESSLAAAAAARLLGLGIAEISAGFSKISLPEHRFREHAVNKWHIIDDVYNANPLSMVRMLEAAKIRAQTLNLPFIAVLGEMGELGEESWKLHKQLGEELARLNPEYIFFKGKNYVDVLAGYESMAAPSGGKICAVDDDTFEKTVSSLLLAGKAPMRGGVVLFKGSRANQLEKYVHKFERLAGEQVKDNVL